MTVTKTQADSFKDYLNQNILKKEREEICQYDLKNNDLFELDQKLNFKKSSSTAQQQSSQGQKQINGSADSKGNDFKKQQGFKNKQIPSSNKFGTGLTSESKTSSLSFNSKKYLKNTEIAQMILQKVQQIRKYLCQDGYSPIIIQKHFINLTIRIFQFSQKQSQLKYHNKFKTFKELLQKIFISKNKQTIRNYLYLILEAFEIQYNKLKKNKKEDIKEYSYQNYQFQEQKKKSYYSYLRREQIQNQDGKIRSYAKKRDLIGGKLPLKENSLKMSISNNNSNIQVINPFLQNKKDQIRTITSSITASNLNSFGLPSVQSNSLNNNEEDRLSTLKSSAFRPRLFQSFLQLTKDTNTQNQASNDNGSSFSLAHALLKAQLLKDFLKQKMQLAELCKSKLQKVRRLHRQQQQQQQQEQELIQEERSNQMMYSCSSSLLARNQKYFNEDSCEYNCDDFQQEEEQ